MTSPSTSNTSAGPDDDTVAAALRRAQRAPSVHNTQPWRWEFDGLRLHLYTDPDRMLPATDPHTRQQIISCGAALHHARAAFAARDWYTETVRTPDPDHPDRLASITFRRWPDPPGDILTRAAAIERRYTDRLPLLDPTGWPELLSRLYALVSPHELALDVLDEPARARLATASARAEAARRDDAMYQMELQWWTGHLRASDGIPLTALISAAESARVDIARAFPVGPQSARRAELADHATLVVLGSYDESVSHWLHAGEGLSAVLLECTAAGLATCALTHVTELPAGRRAVADLLAHRTAPQVVLRIGTAPRGEPPAPRTPRRSLTEVLTIRHVRR